MDRIFHHDDTMYEAATKVYAKTDGYAYFEADYKTKVPVDVLEDLFVRGLIIVDAGVMYKPVSLKIASKVATVTYVKTNSSTTTTADLATVKSA
nr:MAG TPA: hypothetical protein [Caudoviricetes sp.]